MTFILWNFEYHYKIYKISYKIFEFARLHCLCSLVVEHLIRNQKVMSSTLEEGLIHKKTSTCLKIVGMNEYHNS